MAPSEPPADDRSAGEAADHVGYHSTADRFGAVVDAVTDWDAPTPVAGWRARDVVDHLTTWLPGLLGSCGVPMPLGDIGDPVGSWHRQDTAVRGLLASRGDDVVTHVHLGTMPLGQVIAQVYVGDVFMHTWDLARAAGVDDRLDAERCAAMVAGMSAMEAAMRGSGHYGPAWPLPADDTDPQRRLLAFIGRDPDWRPPSS